ncbi:hypothetical protein ABMA28_006130 [Loxostege sticticalis]|uniref:Uncharacterized protein n=1 Tax=Loxostege sticticalis TaxID=481309 RepID=A0ABD0SKV8_LOXSC
MLAVLILCVCATVVCGQNDNRMARMPKYDERYDYLDIDALFNSKRLVRNYVDCLISAQRCTPEGKQLKRILPEALRTKCIRCTERQKKAAVKVIRRLKNEFPEEWAKLSSRWDPTGDFTRYFEEYLANENFNTISGSESSNDVPGPSSLPPLPPVPPRLPAPSTPPPQPAEPASTPPTPVILNRFGDDAEVMMVSPSSAGVTRPTTARPALSPTTVRPPPPPPPPRPTQTTWVSSSSDALPTRFPLRPTNDLPPPYTTAITFIDQIGYKIIRTTELVTDILKNTVRAVVGR